MGNSDYEFLRDWALKQEPFEDIASSTDRDRLAAENAELRRRLEEIARHAAAPNWADIVCAGGKLELATTRLDEIRAIAEGRDNA